MSKDEGILIFDAYYDSLSDETKKVIDVQAKRLRELSNRYEKGRMEKEIRNELK